MIINQIEVITHFFSLDEQMKKEIIIANNYNKKEHQRQQGKHSLNVFYPPSPFPFSSHHHHHHRHHIAFIQNEHKNISTELNKSRRKRRR